MSKHDSFKAAKAVIRKLRDGAHVAYLAGGCVRDRLLNVTPKDHDVATDAPPDAVCGLFRRTKKVGAQFGVVIVSARGCEIEVATFRTDGTYQDGRRPDTVQFGTPRADAMRRDFTINGMFYDPYDDQLIDYVDGQKDLRAKVIRCIGEPDRRFAEDHLRMLRAVRFAARLEFDIARDTFSAIQNHADKLAIISPERIRMELELILTATSRARGWRLLADSGLTKCMVESVSWSAFQSDQVELVLSHLQESVPIPLGMAAICTPFPPATTKRICRNLRCSNEVTEATCHLNDSIAQAFRGNALELADVKVLLAFGLFEELCSLAEAVARAGNTSTSAIEALRERASQIPAKRVSPAPLIGGDDLLEMDLVPGPLFTELLDAIYRAQLNETLETRQQAVAMIRSMITGRTPRD